MNEEEPLTTEGIDPQVNNEVQESNELVVEDQVADTATTDNYTEDAYNDAWDNIDVTDDSIFESSNTNEDSAQVPAEPEVDPLSTTQDTNNNIGAFMVDKPILTYKGKDIPIDSQDELIALAQKGFRMETEAAAMKPKKRALSIIDGIPLEVLQAISDIHNGNKDAISYIKNQYDIKEEVNDDVWGAPQSDEPTKDYTPAIEVDDPIKNFWDEFVVNNKQQSAKVSDIYSSLDESFKNEIYKDNIFQAFVGAVGSGEFDQVYPLAIKEKTLNPAMTWLQAYSVGAQKVSAPVTKQKEPPVSATAPANTANGRNINSGNDADRVWNDDAYYKELEAKLFG